MEEMLMVTIPAQLFEQLVRKAEQRDIMLRFALEEKYAIRADTLHRLCGESVPKDQED